MGKKKEITITLTQEEYGTINCALQDLSYQIMKQAENIKDNDKRLKSMNRSWMIHQFHQRLMEKHGKVWNMIGGD